MGWIIGKGIGVPFRMGSSQSWSSYWSHQSEVLFFGLYSEISGGQMPNKVTGATDYLTVAGATGSETYQCPNTAAYVAADEDFIWFEKDNTQRIATTAELIGYDHQRTPVKYLDDTPNSIIAIMILKSGEIISGTKRDALFRDMWLPILWDNNLNAYGHIKNNRSGQQLFNPYESEIIILNNQLTTPLSKAYKLYYDTFISTLKTGLGITNLSDAFDQIIDLGCETEEGAYKNLVKNRNHPLKVLNPIHVPMEGITGDSDNYINDNFDPSVDGVRYTRNSASIGLYSRTESASASSDFSCSDGTYLSNIIIRNTSDLLLFRINADLSTVSTANTSSLGFFMASRTGSSLTTPYVNGVAGTQTTEASRTLVNLTGRTGGTRQLSMLIKGRGFTSDEVLIIHNAVEVFMDVKGKGVIA